MSRSRWSHAEFVFRAVCRLLAQESPYRHDVGEIEAALREVELSRGGELRHCDTGKDVRRIASRVIRGATNDGSNVGLT